MVVVGNQRTKTVRVGVIDAAGLYLPGGTRHARTRATVDAWAITRACQLDQLWFHPSAAGDAPGGAWLDDGGRGALVNPARWDVGDVAFAGALDGYTLLAAVETFNRALAWPFRYSPGATGRHLADALAPRPRQPVADGDWPAPALNGGLTNPPTMIRLPDDPRGRYMHTYDKNGMYLAACSSVELGLGGLVERHDALLDTSLPGYWEWLPREWYATPGAEMLEDLNTAPVPFESAYVWTEHNRALRPWYERLRDARATLQSDGSLEGRIALAVLKNVYTAAIGHWASPKLRANAPGQYRPDWRHMIEATAHANMRRQITKLDAAGTPPLALTDVDTLWFLSDERDATTAAPPLLRLGSGLGQFKPKDTLDADDGIAHLRLLQDRSAARRARRGPAREEVPHGIAR